MRHAGIFHGDWDRYAEQSRYFGVPRDVPGLESTLEGCSGTFVEIGCGDGNRLQQLSSRRLLERFGRVVAFDVSSERVERTRQRGLPAEIAVGDACALALPHESADFVFSDQVIEHVPDDRVMAAEIARILRAGGKAVVGSVTKASWAWYFYRCNGRWVLDPTHLREYADARAYCEVFESAGLRVESCTSRLVSFSVAELGIRALMRSGLMRNSLASPRREPFGFAERLSSARIPLPGYRLIWAFLRKPDCA